MIEPFIDFQHIGSCCHEFRAKMWKYHLFGGLTYIYISMSCFHIKWLKSLVSLPWIEFKWNARICFFTLKPALDAWGFPDSTTSFVAIPSGCQDVEQVFENGKYALGDAGKQVFFFSFFFFWVSVVSVFWVFGRNFVKS